MNEYTNYKLCKLSQRRNNNFLSVFITYEESSISNDVKEFLQFSTSTTTHRRWSNFTTVVVVMIFDFSLTVFTFCPILIFATVSYCCVVLLFSSRNSNNFPSNLPPSLSLNIKHSQPRKKNHNERCGRCASTFTITCTEFLNGVSKVLFVSSVSILHNHNNQTLMRVAVVLRLKSWMFSDVSTEKNFISKIDEMMKS